MKEEFIDLAKYRIEKAKNTLSDAKKYFWGISLTGVATTCSVPGYGRVPKESVGA